MGIGGGVGVRSKRVDIVSMLGVERSVGVLSYRVDISP